MKRRAERGFSLIEILIAMAILAIGIMAVMKLFPLSLRQAQVAQERTIASELANSRLGRVWTAGAAQLFDKRFEQDPTQRLLNWHWTSATNAAENIYAIYDGFNTTVHRMAGAGDVYLQRVSFTVQMADGRYESFVTYVSQL